MKAYLLAAAILLIATPSFACTAEEAQAKGEELSQKMQELAMKDPQKLNEIAQKMAETQTKSGADLASLCNGFDEILAEFE